mmetsp:Transcript_100607/g.224852  ORF Transcript_100607/g.224852 Transcript_100607/m.224852 type:complete len:192 (+) Transcript_100607:157-732(+)
MPAFDPLAIFADGEAMLRLLPIVILLCLPVYFFLKLRFGGVFPFLRELKAEVLELFGVSPPAQGIEPLLGADSASVPPASTSAIAEPLIQRLRSRADQGLFDIPHEFKCPIVLTVMQDPVLAADGYTYEREAILRWFASGNSHSPMTNAPLASQEVLPNFALRSQIIAAAEEAALATSLFPSGENYGQVVG